MTASLRSVLATAVLAVICLSTGALIYQWHSAAPRSSASAVDGQRLFTVTLPGLDGEPREFSQWRGKILVVNFWATWCEPCREEIPAFIKSQSAFGQDGVQFVGVAIDQRERAAAYARDIGMNYPTVVGGIDTMTLARDLGNRQEVLPFTVVLDRSGRIVSSTIGVFPPDRLQKTLRNLL
jgi:thiol-disulfide isomerase/thioredoxin